MRQALRDIADDDGAGDSNGWKVTYVRRRFGTQLQVVQHLEHGSWACPVPPWASGVERQTTRLVCSLSSGGSRRTTVEIHVARLEVPVLEHAMSEHGIILHCLNDVVVLIFESVRAGRDNRRGL